MPHYIFATSNQNKLQEIKKKLPGSIEIQGLKEIGWTQDIPETELALEGNALLKARTIFEATGKNCFSDDTGLEVEALDGAPGVFSARFAGENSNAEHNMDLLLHKLRDVDNRKARFRTVIALIENGEEKLFEGIVNGVILTERSGAMGFGYDPVFQPDGYEVSFAEMSIEQKNMISHRGLATEKLIQYLSR